MTNKHPNLSGDRNQCAGCAELFNSTFSFDKHRVGSHGVDRRCLTPTAMLEKGFRKNSHGFWVSNPRDKDTQHW